MVDDSNRLVTVVLVVSDLDRAMKLYGAGFGLELHVDDHHGDDPWTSGRHAATSWTEGAFIHFALYASKNGEVTRGAQIALRVADLEAAHARALSGRRGGHPRPEVATVGTLGPIQGLRRQRHRTDVARRRGEYGRGMTLIEVNGVELAVEESGVGSEDARTTIDGAGHLPHPTNVPEWLALVREFVDKS